MTLTSLATASRRQDRSRRIALRQCFHCHTRRSRRLVAHPSGPVLVCQECGHVERVSDRAVKAAG